MKEIITSEWFQIIGVTVISAGLGIFVKYVSRNDSHGNTFRKEDLAIGLEMVITALILIITNSVSEFNKLNNVIVENATKVSIQEKEQIVPWLVLIFIVALWGTSTIIRKIGWENQDQLKIWWGIVFPNIIGITSLLFVFMRIRN